VKRFILIVIFLAVFSVAFVLLGGGKFLKSAGTWIGGLGSKADSMKGKIEEGATSVEKKAEKVKEAVTSVEKKVEKIKEAVTSEDKK
jgi:Sec-independent protein translocase protein TatA